MPVSAAPDPICADRRAPDADRLRRAYLVDSRGAGGCGGFSKTAIRLWLPEVHGARSQPGQRSRTQKPMSTASQN
jgi:hypothetical protein